MTRDRDYFKLSFWHFSSRRYKNSALSLRAFSRRLALPLNPVQKMFWKLLLCCAIIKLALCEVESQTQCESPDKVEATTPFTPQSEEQKEENEMFKREAGLPGPCPRTGEPICKCGLNLENSCDECTPCDNPCELQNTPCDPQSEDLRFPCEDCAQNHAVLPERPFPFYQPPCPFQTPNNLPFANPSSQSFAPFFPPPFSCAHETNALPTNRPDFYPSPPFLGHPISGDRLPRCPCDSACEHPAPCDPCAQNLAESIPRLPFLEQPPHLPDFPCGPQKWIEGNKSPFLECHPPAASQIDTSPFPIPNFLRIPCEQPCFHQKFDSCKAPCELDQTPCESCSSPCLEQPVCPQNCPCGRGCPCSEAPILHQGRPSFSPCPCLEQPVQQNCLESSPCGCPCSQAPILNQEFRPIFSPCDACLCSSLEQPACTQNCLESSPCGCPCSQAPINQECPTFSPCNAICDSCSRPSLELPLCPQNCLDSSSSGCPCSEAPILNQGWRPIFSPCDACLEQPVCPQNCLESSPCGCPCSQAPINQECGPIFSPCLEQPVCPQNCLESSPCGCPCSQAPIINQCNALSDSVGCPLQLPGQISRIRPVVIERVRHIPIVQNSIHHQQEFLTREIPIVESHVTQQEEQVLRHVPIVHKYFEPVLESRTRFVPIFFQKLRTVSEPCMTHVPIVEKRFKPVQKCVVQQVPVYEKRCVPVSLQTVRKIPVTERICRPVVKSHITQIPVKERLVKNFIERVCFPGPNPCYNEWLPCSPNSCDLPSP